MSVTISEAKQYMLLITALVTILYQLFFFFIAAGLKVDTFTDLAGGSNFVVLAFITWAVGTLPDPSARQWALTFLVVAWGIRLSAFLFIRILYTKEDHRFDEIRGDFCKFFAFWFFQMIWVWVVSLPLTYINSLSSDPASSLLTGTDIVGIIFAIVGLALETVADQQKFTFKQDASNRAKYIDTGVWKYSRHPNYFGELLFWWGIFISASTSFANIDNTAYYTIVSPLFITWLLLGASGMPILESGSNKRFGKQIEYLEYRKNTSILIPLPHFVYGNLPDTVKAIFLFEWVWYAGGFEVENSSPNSSEALTGPGAPKSDSGAFASPSSSSSSSAAAGLPSSSTA